MALRLPHFCPKSPQQIVGTKEQAEIHPQQPPRRALRAPHDAVRPYPQILMRARFLVRAWSPFDILSGTIHVLRSYP